MCLSVRGETGKHLAIWRTCGPMCLCVYEIAVPGGDASAHGAHLTRKLCVLFVETLFECNFPNPTTTNRGKNR